MKKYKVENTLFIVFLIIGILFLSIGVFVYKLNVIDKEDRVKTTAVIIDIYNNGDDHDVLISYEVEGITYERCLNSYMSSYYEGKEITIYYDINNPAKIMEDTTNIILYVFGGIGVFFIFVSLIILITKKMKDKKIKELRETGNIINAKYLSTQINKNYTVNNKHPYNIICEWDNSMDGKKYIFKSENIWIDPEKIINQRGIKTFRVYYNPYNLKQYYVDVDMLLDTIVDLR